ncbi:MAG TPA: GH116 family glycosyl hydrolase [Bacteroidales bacterium]|nr:GH116 family glycosyl hydrolase [Bacteroidales bacterium]
MKNFVRYMPLIAAGLIVTAVSCSSGKHDLSPDKHQYNGYYEGRNLDRIAFPIGGIGAGMFCLEGTGGISHMSVRNKPDIYNEPCMFAAISVRGFENGTKVIEGPVPDWKKFGQPGSGNGSEGTTYGLPRFDEARFIARFPFASIELHDADLPLEIKLTGWSPFIPTDQDNSSLPAGAFEYTFKNTGSSPVEAVFSYSARNFMSQPDGKNSIKQASDGFVLSEEGVRDKPETKGWFSVYSNDPSTIIDYCWFRGGWWDPLTMAWKTIKNCATRNSPPVSQNAPGATLFVPFTLPAGGTKTVRVMFTWYVPDSNLKYGEEDKSRMKKECSGKDCCTGSPFYKPWYSGKFRNIEEVSAFWQTNYDDLRKKSELFSNSFYSQTLPPEVIEAVAANLTILKSPTVLRQTDGRLWSWEGCGDSWGCCAGSCEHVWNYAQAICHLFPVLERSLRETEYTSSQDSSGHQTFRSALPVRPVANNFYAASDGQLGGIMKMYRDWRISGNTEWLKKMYPLVVRSMNYCIATWDPRLTGTLEEPHHNTYDIEFWGPDGMCTGFYLGALKSMALMGKALGEDVSRYEKLYAKGRMAMENELFNGEYFFQKVRWKDLKAANPEIAMNDQGNNVPPEEKERFMKEGPKYQYGTGCLSDGVLGAWIGAVCGIDNIIDSSKIASHLNSVFRYNFVRDLSNHSNPQRPAYALGKEGGLILCTWPKGGALSIPFPYSDEVWTGYEYQVASHLMLIGEPEKGLEIVRTCRDRYDGKVRNPFDEYECGHWYARAMSSYGLLQGLTGVRYDAVSQELYIDSRVGDFNSFLATETGFGNVGLKDGKPFLKVEYGEIPVKSYSVKKRVP